MEAKERAEICIIGGGIYGLVIAFHLVEAGRDVLVVDQGPIAMEASMSNAGTVAVQNKPLKMLPQMLEAAHLWEGLSDKLGFDVGYQRIGGLRIAITEEEIATLEALVPKQRSLGVPLEWMTADVIRKELPFLANSVQAAAYCSLDGKANPFKTCLAFSRAIRQKGGRFLTHSPVKSVRLKGDHIDIGTPQVTIKAEKIVNAAGAWAASVSAMMGVSLPITWVVNTVSITTPGPIFIPNIITHVRGNMTLKQLDGRIVIGGAWRGDGDPYIGQKKVNLSNLKGNIDLACQMIPELRKFQILRSWVGFQGQSPDRLFVIGELPPYNQRMYAMVGGSGGFSLAPVFGEITAKWILTGSAPNGMEIFDVRRYCGAHGS